MRESKSVMGGRMVPASWMVVSTCVFGYALGLGGAGEVRAVEARPVVGKSDEVKTGVARFVPDVRDERLPERFRLPAHEFNWRELPRPPVSERLSISDVTFPSPVVTPHEANNTIHCEYYRPQGTGKRPAVIVLHILGGDFPLARVFANGIAQRGTAALFLKMPYYGPRRPPNSPRRMISHDPRETVEGMTQAILDIRQAAAFLASREEIDPEQLGVFGISLGGITGALALTAEPRLRNGCLILAGGDMARIAWESEELAELRDRWVNGGGSKTEFFDLMKQIDPVTYSATLGKRRVLMMNATDDEVVPKVCTESLWRAFGEPPIIWYDGGHYSVARHLLAAMKQTQDFFAPAP